MKLSDILGSNPEERGKYVYFLAPEWQDSKGNLNTFVTTNGPKSPLLISIITQVQIRLPFVPTEEQITTDAWDKKLKTEIPVGILEI